MNGGCGGVFRVLREEGVGTSCGIEAGNDSSEANEIESKKNNSLLVGDGYGWKG
jgi:hypothetical protein